MSKPWGGIGIGAWADEAERADEEQAAAAADVESFPSLKEAASNAKSKKKKKMMMTLSEFTSGAYAAPGGRSSVGLTQQEILQLPTGPRQRSEDEMQQPGRLGGGFSSYGGRGPRDRDDSGGGRRPYGGGFDDERRGDQSRVSDFPQASRADEDDDWGKAKKLQSFDQGRHGRYSGLGGGGGGSYNGGGGFSRADETDNWAAGTQSQILLLQYTVPDFEEDLEKRLFILIKNLLITCDEESFFYFENFNPDFDSLRI